MQKKSVRFIVNPFSGTSEKENLTNLLHKHLDHSLYEYEICVTEGPGHGRALSEKAVKSLTDMVVAVGGDGTINEIAEPLKQSKTILGILPGGSGNGFATHLGISRNLRKAIGVLNHGKVITVDSCLANNDFYLNVAGVGFDALVAYNTKTISNRGITAYIKGILREAFSYKNEVYRVEWEDQVLNEKFLSIEVANASFYGYNFAIAPQAKLQDGRLDLVMVKNASKLSYILSFWRLFARSIHKSSITRVASALKVRIISDKPMFYHLDGEAKIADNGVSFSIIPRSLKVWVPDYLKNP